MITLFLDKSGALQAKGPAGRFPLPPDFHERNPEIIAELLEQEAHALHAKRLANIKYVVNRHPSTAARVYSETPEWKAAVQRKRAPTEIDLTDLGLV